MALSTGLYANLLRRELCLRNAAFAASRELPHVASYGEMPVIVYQGCSENRRHGNFLDTTYAAILDCPEWKRRLDKAHSQARRSLPKGDSVWKELDSSMSSDALLMNVFCYPGSLKKSTLGSMLGVLSSDVPEFGFRARVPLSRGRADRTEVDMKLGKLLVEAKLTEGDFQVGTARAVESYRDLEEVFDCRMLPQLNGQYLSYQLLRNVLAAHALGLDFCVLLDQRRPDLQESWFTIMSCVRIPELRTRCKVLTWQELSAALPPKLREFLDWKYGIVPPGKNASNVKSTNL
jgi:hypothetical protein